MMKKLIKKLRSRLKGTGGESLAEVLVAMLVAALALTMLASVIGTASDMIRMSKTATEAYYDESNKLEQQTAPEDTQLTIRVTENVSSHPGVKLTVSGGNISVNWYLNDKLSGEDVISYKKG